VPVEEQQDVPSRRRLLMSVQIPLKDLESVVKELRFIEGELTNLAEDDLDYLIDLAYGLGEVIQTLSKYLERGGIVDVR